MTSETASSPAIPPPQEHHSVHQALPQIPVNSDPISAAPPSPPRVMMKDNLNRDGILTDQRIDEIEEPYYYKYLDSKEYADKYRRYESEFKQYLLAKYFSGKDPNGGDIFEESTTIDGETIMSSKWPCTLWYADPGISYATPVQCLDEEEEEEESVDSASAEISHGEISNGGTVSEKNSS